MKRIKVVTDNGVQLLEMPNGDRLPGIVKTVVKQDTEQSAHKLCTVIVVIEAEFETASKMVIRDTTGLAEKGKDLNKILEEDYFDKCDFCTKENSVIFWDNKNMCKNCFNAFKDVKCGVCETETATRINMIDGINRCEDCFNKIDWGK